jgi:hypothetical protein
MKNRPNPILVCAFLQSVLFAQTPVYDTYINISGTPNGINNGNLIVGSQGTSAFLRQAQAAAPTDVIIDMNGVFAP